MLIIMEFKQSASHLIEVDGDKQKIQIIIIFSGLKSDLWLC